MAKEISAMTNYERIKSMTKNELAVFLCELVDECDTCFFKPQKPEDSNQLCSRYWLELEDMYVPVKEDIKE